MLELGRFNLQLRQRLRKPMGHLHVAPFQFADELGFVVAGDTQRLAVRHHGHHQLQHVDHAGAAVHQVADENGLASLRVVHRRAIACDAIGIGMGDPVSQAFQQRHQFIGSSRVRLR